jgi:hypothetical protein
VVIRRGDADRVTLVPITQTQSAHVTAPADGSGRTEQPLGTAPLAASVAAPPVPLPPGDHRNPASTDPSGTLTTDLVGTDPVSVDVQTAALSETAAAVAYWRDQHPRLRPAEIAAHVGKSERHVRRILATLDDIEQPRPNGAPVSNIADAHR